MGDWRRICCAVDFSGPSRAAMEEAAHLAQRLRVPIVILHVEPVDALAPELLFAPPPRGATCEDDSESMLRRVTEAAQRIAPGLATSVELGGTPAAEIVRFAREFACDLVVVGTHGRTGLRRLALGSVAEQIVRTAGCPVLVVRGEAAS